MVNDVNGIGNQPHRATKKIDEGAINKAAPMGKNNPYAAQASTQGDDSIQLSNLAKKMSEFETKARSSDGIDAAKVNELKASIDNNNYQVNPESLAASIIKNDSLL